VLVVGGAFVVLASGTAQGTPPPQTTFAQQTFTGPSAGSDFVKPAAPSATNVACLTAGTDTSASPIPDCGTGDATGSGALRLTDSVNFEAGGVGSTVSVPITNGLDATFDSYEYGGTGADGMTFYLAATDPINPHIPTELGQFGGSLGYSAQPPTLSGLADGYLGIGLDPWGNFPTPGFGGSTCAPLSASPNTITVRGPGNGVTGYCVVDQHVLTHGALRSDDTTRSATDIVPVEVVVNPSASAANALVSGVAVPAKSYAVIVTAIGSLGVKDVLIGALPSTTNAEIPAGLYDSSWIDPSTGYPYKLTFGWTAGTGAANDKHEVTNFKATTLLGRSPVLRQTTTGAKFVLPNTSSTVVIRGSVSSSGGAEHSPVVATTVFPTGFTPANGSTALWTCAITGQTETCTYAPIAGIPSGKKLPALSLPYSVDGTLGTSTITTSLSSLDAAAVAGSLSVTVTTTLPVEVLPVTGSSLDPTTGGGLGLALLAAGFLVVYGARRNRARKSRI
jgi:hypothetical protein